jgi:hypothetical protein
MSEKQPITELITTDLYVILGNRSLWVLGNIIIKAIFSGYKFIAFFKDL